VLPQEHGHRTGVRWLALGPARRGGRRTPSLLVVADPSAGSGTVGMAVRRHGDDELWRSSHTDDLARIESARPPRTVVYLDAAQRGLGTGSCGPDALDRYRVGAGTHTVSVWFRSFDPSSEDPAALARSVRAAR
jgi:beta-galactosidase